MKVVVAVVHRLTLMKSRDEINTATRGAENATQMMIPQVHPTLIYHQWIQGDEDIEKDPPVKVVRKTKVGARKSNPHSLGQLHI